MYAISKGMAFHRSLSLLPDSKGEIHPRRKFTAENCQGVCTRVGGLMEGF
jgi:hypothetical protein